LIRFLIWVLIRFVFVFLVCPAIFAGAFLGLVRLGFSPRVLDVWGLAIVVGSLALLALKPLEALWTKIRGPSPPPQLPAGARRAIYGLFGLGGAGLASAAAFGVLAFVTVGSWWPLEEPMGLGTIIVEPNPGAGDHAYTLTFEPSRGDKALGAEGVEVGGDVVAFELRRVRFEGTAAKLVSQVGLRDVIWPGQVYVKIDASGDDEAVAADLAAPPMWISEKVLELLTRVPGTTLETLRSEWIPFGTGFRRDLVLEGPSVKLVGAGAGPPPKEPLDPPPKPPPPTRDPTGTPPPTDAPPPTRSPTDPPVGGDPGDSPDGPVSRPPSAAEMALLRTGDPFEGLD
jgi:hypothetical protein